MGKWIREDSCGQTADRSGRIIRPDTFRPLKRKESPSGGVTVQNEAKAEQGWESCHYGAGEERDFVTGFLKPAYEKQDWVTERFFLGSQ